MNCSNRRRLGSAESRVGPRSIALAGLLCAFAESLSGSFQAGQPTFTTSSAAVVVDVVARDHDQRPVAGLRAADFEIYEDGVRQTITAFDEVGGSGLSASEEQGSVPGNRVRSADRAPGVIALAFEQLSPAGAQLAEKAATDFVSHSMASGDHAAVFNLDRGLHLVVPYSAEPFALLKGVREIARRPGYALEHAAAVPNAEFDTPEGGQPSRSSQDDSPFIRGHATLDALDGVIASLEGVPGRKVVILFSEGLALMPAEDKSLLGGTAPAPDSWLSDNRRDHFNRVIEHANRAHVAFYTFDAAGLRIESRNVQQMCFGCAPYVGLQFLADETGGVFVDSRNDLRTSVQRVAADLGHYYLLGYTSTNTKVDNTFRRLEVKTQRKDVTLLTRKGYVAAAKVK
jgi:VWFA-related protein